MPSTRRTVALAVALCLAVGAVSLAATADDRSDDSAGAGGLHSSWSFDVTDKVQLMNYSEEVVIARVVGADRVDEDAASTWWTVQVLDAVKGKRVEGRLRVRQLGHVDNGGRRHETDH